MKRVAVVSPDGRNEIRLTAEPLGYEVLRDGVAVVAKSEIGLKVDGKNLAEGLKVTDFEVGGVIGLSGKEATPVYKKDSIDLSANVAFVSFGDWGVRLAARNDGVAYRFETKKAGEITIDGEYADLVIPEVQAKCWAQKTNAWGCEEAIPVASTVADLGTADAEKIYLPFAYTVGGKWIAVTESDLHDYPALYFTKGEGARFGSTFAKYPRATSRVGGWGGENVEKGGRWVRVTEQEDYLVKSAGTRTFPWRTFILADAPVKFCEADIVRVLASAAGKDSDFSWVKPGKVAWDWWNCFDNLGDPEGCTTKTYERFIDFAAKNGVEYVIFDEGWSEKLNIWKFSPVVDVPYLIDYANKKGVGIILWMAWAQVYGDEERVASHFAKLGAKGFKIDFMDRADAEIANFLEKFAAACAKEKMIVDYHGVYRPTGLERKYPNVVNYEGIHGLEQMKWFRGGMDEDEKMMFNDVAAFYLRMSAGPMDYTPGAMLNHAFGTGYQGKGSKTPGSVGTRCRQMAMMVLYEAPLQMLCDSPTNYEKNMESFKFMAAVPTVWKRTIGIAGCPDSMAIVARQAKNGDWYVAGISKFGANCAVDYSFLGEGEWICEEFSDGPNSGRDGTDFTHITNKVTPDMKRWLQMNGGGGFVMKLTRILK